MKNSIIASLKDRGIEVITKSAYKNGVEIEGITLSDSRISPIIYFEDIEEMLTEHSFEEVVGWLEGIFKMKATPNFSLDILTDREKFLSHLFVGIQRASEQELVKRPCEEMNGDTELYLYARCSNSEDGFFSCKINHSILSQIDCTEEEAWERATENSCEESTLKSMSELLFGFSDEDDMLFVLSNNSGVNGASSIVNRALLKDFATKKGTSELIILPSSVDELIVIPSNMADYDNDTLEHIVKGANEEAVEPRKRLAERAYFLAV